MAIRAKLYRPSQHVQVVQPKRQSAGARRNTIVAGRYLLLERVGSGGTAAVYRARDLRRGGEVALKVLHPGLVDDEFNTERFHREAWSLARLRHPHIVRVFGHGACDRGHYIAMELVPGRSLRSLIDSEAPVEPSRATDMALQILDAVGFMHTRGVLHRDLKSANVIVDPFGTVKVVDFGIASSGAVGMTPTGSLFGTVEYMSPERLMGGAATTASDVYSIGIILYEMLTGRLPFDGELIPTVALKHLNEDPVPPARVNYAVGSDLSAIVMHALAKTRRDRYPDAAAFSAALCRQAARQTIEPAALAAA